MVSVTFVNPEFLWFLFSLPFLFLVHIITVDFTKRRAVRFANFEALKRADQGIRGAKLFSNNMLLLILQIITLLLLVFAIAGTTLWYEGVSSDYDFVIAIDASGSMLANDFSPNRLEAAKESAIRFIENIKKKTNVGVLSFSGTGFIKQEMTDNKADVINSIYSIDIEFAGGTALGDAIITGTNMFHKSDKAAVIILLTDGQSNVGVPVDEAIAYANKQHVTVHTIGVATSEGGSLAGIPSLSRLDEEELKKIAETTGGKFFKVDSKEKIDAAYSEINTATKRKIPVRLTVPFVILALIITFVQWVLINTKYRTIP